MEFMLEEEEEKDVAQWHRCLLEEGVGNSD